MIKCGRCSTRGGAKYHETVADVRKCFNGEPVSSTQGTMPAAKRLTEAQVAYARKLLDQLGAVYTGSQPMEELGRATDGRVLLDGLVKARQDKSAGRAYVLPPMTAQSSKPAADTTARTVVPEVTAGYYATDSLTGAQDTDFWFVTVVEREDKWFGFRVVSRVIGGRSPVRVKGSTRVAALKAIAKAGEREAQLRFAKELGRCYKCGKHLTDETSRELGIGPVCRAA